MRTLRVLLDLERRGLAGRTSGFAVRAAILDAELTHCPLPFESNVAIGENGVLILAADEGVIDDEIKDKQGLRWI